MQPLSISAWKRTLRAIPELLCRCGMNPIPSFFKKHQRWELLSRLRLLWKRSRLLLISGLPSRGKNGLRRNFGASLVLVLFTSSCCFASSPLPQSAHPSTAASQRDEARLAKAMDDINQGNDAEAERLLQSLHSRIHGSFQIDESLGLLYARQGKMAAALPFLKEAVQDRPKDDVAHANLAVANLKMNRLQAALQEFERAVGINPSNGRAQEYLGFTLASLKKPGPAAAAFEAALREKPADPDLLYNAALARFQNNQPALAAALLQRIPEAASSAPEQSLYGEVEERLGHYLEAAKHLQTAARLDPTESTVYALGLEFLRHWTFTPAIQEFSAGVKRFPESQRMQLGLGIAYYGNRDYTHAISVFADLLAAYPNNQLAAQLFGRSCAVFTEGMNPHCGSLVEFAKLHPKDAVLATYAAISILHQSSTSSGMETARSLLHSATSADPELPEAQLETGALLQMESKWKESIPPLETAIRLQPSLTEAHYRLARAYARAGRHQDAQKQIVLYNRYRKQQEKSLDARMSEITTLVVKMQ